MRSMHLFFSATLTAFLIFGCGANPAQDYNTQTGELGNGDSSATLAAQLRDQEPKSDCDEVTDGYIQVIEALSNWHFGEVDKSHPDYCKIVEEILDALYKYLEDAPSLVDVDTEINIVNEFFILDGVSISAFTETNVASDGTVTATMTFYNPSAPTGSTGSSGGGGGGPLAAATSQKSAKPVKPDDPPTKDEIEKTVHHEFGHILWGMMSEADREIWTVVWEVVIALEVQPYQPYTDKDGKVANYFEVNAMEGFCVAWSFIQTDLPVDSTIQNFFDNLPL